MKVCSNVQWEAKNTLSLSLSLPGYTFAGYKLHTSEQQLCTSWIRQNLTYLSFLSTKSEINGSLSVSFSPVLRLFSLATLDEKLFQQFYSNKFTTNIFNLYLNLASIQMLSFHRWGMRTWKVQQRTSEETN